jgi:anti-anti-sigma factor
MNNIGDLSADSRGPGPWLRVELHSYGRTCTLVLHGELCDTSIAALEAQVDQLGCIPCDDVIVDVRELAALDSVGANVLLGLHHYVDGRGGHLRVMGATGEIATILHQYALEYAEADEGLTATLDGSSPLADRTDAAAAAVALPVATERDGPYSLPR